MQLNAVLDKNFEWRKLISVNLIETPPDAVSIMESTRAIGYSLPVAIADIIDNSIAAEAERIEIFYSATEKYVAILDDGCGMNSDEINIAMKYGGISPLDKRHESDLGRFGLGMKTASLSQCKILTVVSKKNNELSARQWDLNTIYRLNSWALLELSSEEIKLVPKVDLLKDFSNGTLVVWQEFDRMFQGNKNVERFFPEKMQEVREHLSLVFHRYLTGEEGLKKISISVNNLPVEPSDSFLKYKNTQVMPTDVISLEGYPPIKFVAYRLPHTSKLKVADKKSLGITADLQKNQGFYVYRSKRLIVWGTWFNRAKKDFLSQLARIQVDIPPDFDNLWVLDIKKSVAVPPAIVSKSFDALIENLATKSKRTWEHRGKHEIDKNTPHFWNRLETRDGEIFYEINETHPIFLRLIEKFPACEDNFKNLLKLIAASLPINQMKFDIQSNNVEITNHTHYSEDDVRKILKTYIEGLSKIKAHKLLDSLATDAIFKNYTNLIEEFRRSVDR